MREPMIQLADTAIRKFLTQNGQNQTKSARALADGLGSAMFQR